MMPSSYHCEIHDPRVMDSGPDVQTMRSQYGQYVIYITYKKTLFVALICI